MSKREISQKALREGAADELNQDKSWFMALKGLLGNNL